MRNQTTLLKLGMAACSALLVIALAGFASSLRGQPIIAQAPEPAPAANEIPTPQPITSAHVPILMYHHLKDLGADADPEYQELAVAPIRFKEHVSYLQREGYQTITFAELVAAFAGQSELPDKPVIITFDDGWDDIYRAAYPILLEYGMSATFFIPTNWVENLDGVVSWAQIEEMRAGGMEFGSHSFTHPYLTESGPDWLEYELQESKSALEEHTGKPVIAFAYPFGLYDDTVIQAVRDAGYLAACTIDHGAMAIQGELLTLPRLWVKDWMDLEDFAALLEAAS